MSLYRMPADELAALVIRTTTLTMDNPEMLQPLAPFGFDAQRLEGARNLGLDLREKARVHKELTMKKENSTRELHEATADFHVRTISGHVGVAEFAFRGQHAFMKTLRVAPNARKGFYRWLGATLRFYETILSDPETRDRMVGQGITIEGLEAARARALEIEALDQSQERLKALTQDARATRDVTHREAADWQKQFRKVARGAWTDHPDWLEQIGVVYKPRK
jgi:hypothetical protein